MLTLQYLHLLNFKFSCLLYLPRRGYTEDDVFSDNDELSVLVAKECRADLLIILTDVDGVYTKPPSQPNAKLISVFPPLEGENRPTIGEGSKWGRGGMGAKIKVKKDDYGRRRGKTSRSCIGGMLRRTSECG